MNDLPPVYPFAAIVGQERMKTALILNAIDPGLSGVLIRGDKGTAKSTAVRGLAELLPEATVVQGCSFNCPPRGPFCPDCRDRIMAGDDFRPVKARVKVVELPVGATEDRVLGTLDLEAALQTGKRSFSPGLLAQANGNILYVDEVNLLDDHLVDVLLDSAAMGQNVVEREGVSFVHPARFTLVGTMNPEEGELRPQLLDRFGLCVQVEGLEDPESRAEVVRRRLAFEADPRGFGRAWKKAGQDLARKISQARRRLRKVLIPPAALDEAVRIALLARTDGHRADLTAIKAARALTALAGRDEVALEDVRQAARLALPHRLKRKPFEEMVFDLEEYLTP